MKQGFQSRFALIPLVLLAVFLAASALYLYDYLQESFRFYLYLPHNPLENPWEEFAPALARVAGWGGGAFLLALAVWGWRRFSRLKADLSHLAGWLDRLPEGGEGGEPIARLGDGEVRELAAGLESAARFDREWRAEVAERARALAAAAEEMRAAGPEDAVRMSRRVRRALEALRESVARVRVDERLS